MDIVPIADTIQVAADTLIVVQPQAPPDTLLDWLSFGATLGVVVATGLYVYYTSQIYKETQDQTESAEQSAAASQESLEEQKRVNKATIKSIQRRNIERSHPLLWMDISVPELDSEEWIELRLQNTSDVPAIEVQSYILAEYSEEDHSWEHFSQYVEESMQDCLDDDTSEFGLHTRAEVSVAESDKTHRLRLKYPIFPLHFHIFLQYRSIHGENYVRYFWIISRPGEDDGIERRNLGGYEIYKTVPISVRVFDTIKICMKKVDDSTRPRPFLLKESDQHTHTPIEMIDRYYRSGDQLLKKVAKYNHKLENSFSTRVIPSFKASPVETGIYAWGVITPPV